ncbi:hypothetical protein SEVIR_2G268100v4 [Setaria viridis]|uniref:TMV response-related protein n=1 Tax=Setaria viridis TaxID=4556 RepID=A0A4U6VVE9_SETVI|nr:uncharacterized protein LOC117845576 [Setaria viridis]TKW33878.1 hypothetical protein SEVIR_2G268100v2 [Setaria viridis]
MGSCVSRSGAVSAGVAESVHALTAKVVGLDGSMAQFAAPVTAHEALAATASGTASTPPRFLCCSDELDFDAPARALGARDALRPGQLYFALPASMLQRPLSAQDMAALAVKASAALGTAPVVATADAGAPGVPPSLERSKPGAATASNKRQQQRRQTSGRRVAPLVVVSAHADEGDAEWKSDHVHGHGGYGDARKAESGDRTVGKARQGVVGHRGVARRPAAVQRLSAIEEAASE